MRTFTYFHDSQPVTTDTAPTFQGLWLHYPEDEQATSHNFLYGKNDRSYSMDMGGTDLQFSGREFKVVEFGEHREDEFSCTVIIPHGPDYYEERDALREFATSKNVVVARDNRGHVVFGVIQALEEAHGDEGSSFSFDVNRVHREVWEII